MDEAERLHLIGSIPLGDSEQVFRRLADELGPFLRCLPDGPRPVVVVHADIRRGRPAEQRERLARALTALLTERLGVEDVVLYVTEHDATEIFRDGRFTDDWQAR